MTGFITQNVPPCSSKTKQNQTKNVPASDVLTPLQQVANWMGICLHRWRCHSKSNTGAAAHVLPAEVVMPGSQDVQALSRPIFPSDLKDIMKAPTNGLCEDVSSFSGLCALSCWELLSWMFSVPLPIQGALVSNSCPGHVLQCYFNSLCTIRHTEYLFKG